MTATANKSPLIGLLFYLVREIDRLLHGAEEPLRHAVLDCGVTAVGNRPCRAAASRRAGGVYVLVGPARILALFLTPAGLPAVARRENARSPAKNRSIELAASRLATYCGVAVGHHSEASEEQSGEVVSAQHGSKRC